MNHFKLNISIIRAKNHLGRESRVVDGATGITTYKAYDNMGRLARVSVPQKDKPDAYAWTLNDYEASPRNMLIMKTLPGQHWHTQKKSSKTSIYTNTTVGDYSCYRLTVSSSDGITMNGKYAAGTLMIEETTDEDGYISRTFTDLEGKGTDFYYTYNVYDDYGRLRYVLPPNLAASSYAANSGTLAKLAFIYKYDSRGRLVYTKTPGSAAEEIVYSPAGRVIVFKTQEDGSRMVKIDKLNNGDKVTGTKLIRALNSDSHKVTIASNGTSNWTTQASGTHLSDGIGENTNINFGFKQVLIPTLCYRII